MIVAETVKMLTGKSKDVEWETDDEDDGVAAKGIVLVELFGTFTDDLVKNPNLRAKFIGLDTAQPMVQLGNQARTQWVASGAPYYTSRPSQLLSTIPSK